MAIKYPGDRNLIGYGAAQVFKPISTDKIEKQKDRGERQRLRKAQQVAKRKLQNQKALTDLLKENDLSKVRNADIPFLTGEFDNIIKQANAVVRKGGNPGTDMQLQRRLNEYTAKISQSALGRERYDENLKTATESEDFQNSENIDALTMESKSPMFGANASYFSVDAQGEEGQEGYVPGQRGTQVNRLKPTLQVQAHEKSVTDNIKPQDISVEAGQGFKLRTSVGDYLTFNTKKEATDAQLDMVANDLYNTYKYRSDMQQHYNTAALQGGYMTEDENGNPVADVMGYLKNKAAGMINEVESKGIRDVEEDRRTFVNLDQQKAQRTLGVIGSETYDFHTSPNIIGEGDIYDAQASMGRSNVAKFTPVGNQLDVSSKGVSGTQDFFNMQNIGQVYRTEAFQSAETDEKGNPKFISGGMSTITGNVEFQPSRIGKHNIAKSNITLPNGEVLRKGEIVPDIYVEANKDNISEEIMMFGTTKGEKGTYAIPFKGQAKSKFQKWVDETSDVNQSYKQAYDELGWYKKKEETEGGEGDTDPLAIF